MSWCLQRWKELFLGASWRVPKSRNHKKRVLVSHKNESRFYYTKSEQKNSPEVLNQLFKHVSIKIAKTWQTNPLIGFLWFSYDFLNTQKVSIKLIPQKMAGAGIEMEAACVASFSSSRLLIVGSSNSTQVGWRPTSWNIVCWQVSWASLCKSRQAGVDRISWKFRLPSCPWICCHHVMCFPMTNGLKKITYRQFHIFL